MKKNQLLEEMPERVREVLEANPDLMGMFPDPAIAAAVDKPDLTLEQAIDTILEGYADRPALGMRDYEIAEDPSTGKTTRRYLPSYSTSSYDELRQRIRAIASALQHAPAFEVQRDEPISIIGFAGVDYVTIMLACLYTQGIPSPLQSVTSTADLDAIFKRVQPKTLAATTSDLVVAARHAVKHGMRNLIAFDYDERDDEDRSQLEAARAVLSESEVEVNLTTIDQLVEFGSQIEWTFLPAHPDSPDRTTLILHSSGSTGVPKGAMMTEASVRLMWTPTSDKLPEVGICFAPLNHGMGAIGVFSALRKGSTCYFTVKPDMSTLFEDIRLVRPTQMAFFPRVLDLIYQHYLSEVSRRLREGDTEAEVQRQVREEMRTSFLGDRLMLAIVGSAPTPLVVKQFFSECFHVDLREGYSSTESGATVTYNDRIQRQNVIDYRLRDVPELGYYTTDRPYPRGELTLKNRFMIKGYYRDPEATAGLFDEDGFLLTGDIVEERGPDHVVPIDRRKDVQKLSQGEYVAVGPLGALFEGGSAVIRQIYIYGNSSRPYIVAVVVPDADEIAARLGNDRSEVQVTNLIRDELQRVAQQKGLKSFEVPRDFILETEPFSQENGLLSSVHKRLRPALKRKYGERLEALYNAHDEKQAQDLAALRDPASPLTTVEKLTKLLEVTLGVEGIDTTRPRTFEELGGDSLGALEFAMAIEEIFDVDLPADSIISPTGCLQKWAEEVDSLISNSNGKPTFSNVHGKHATHIHAKDLALETFLGASAMESAKAAAAASTDTRTVLLTGANGFLGRHICLQWMERLAEKGGKLICIVRGVDDEAARKRLNAAFTGPDPALEARYLELAEKHLEVLAGDAGEHLLGLGEEVFARLASEVDRICHVAALVNHRLAYEHLFGPNVVGTAEIIRLATTERKKPIEFVSTLGVLPLLDMSKGDHEQAPPLESIPLTDRYAGGYAASKWAGEHLLRQANRELGVSVNILRGNMMLPHESYRGQINTGDLFTRLLYSIVITGLAPQSFYVSNDNGQHHYDGLPVDIVAASVIAASEIRDDECLAFNIHNFHDNDGCSLDAFVDWIESAGHRISRIPNHGEWLARFSDKLHVLPEEQKKQSAIDILGAYAHPIEGNGATHMACKNYQALVKSELVETGIPHLNEAYIHKCLADMESLGMIERTHASQRA